MRAHPVITIVAFAFHTCLIVTPLFDAARVILVMESWNVSWWYLPTPAADVITVLMETEGGARLRAYTNAYVHCGLCSDACHHFLSKDNDPRLSPAGKVKQTVSRILNKKTKLDVDFVKQACETVFTECNLCRRCAIAIYCPFGIDLAYLILFARTGLPPARRGAPVYTGYSPQPCFDL